MVPSSRTTIFLISFAIRLWHPSPVADIGGGGVRRRVVGVVIATAASTFAPIGVQTVNGTCENESMPIVSPILQNPLADGRQSERAMIVRRGVQRLLKEMGAHVLPELSLSTGRRA